MSMTMETFCGGVPTVMETVRLTLWWKRSLLGGLGRYPVGITCDLSGKASTLASVWQCLIWVMVIMEVCRMRRMASLRHGFVAVYVVWGLIVAFLNVARQFLGFGILIFGELNAGLCGGFWFFTRKIVSKFSGQSKAYVRH